MPKRKPGPVTLSTPQKGRSKLKGGIRLEELLRARDWPAGSCDEKGPGWGAGRGQPVEDEAKDSPRTAFTVPG